MIANLNKVEATKCDRNDKITWFPCRFGKPVCLDINPLSLTDEGVENPLHGPGQLDGTNELKFCMQPSMGKIREINEAIFDKCPQTRKMGKSQTFWKTFFSRCNKLLWGHKMSDLSRSNPLTYAISKVSCWASGISHWASVIGHQLLGFSYRASVIGLQSSA